MNVRSRCTSALAIVALWLGASCTDDFSRFKFNGQPSHDAGPTLADADVPAPDAQIAETALESAGHGGHDGDDAAPLSDAMVTNAGHEATAGQSGAGQTGLGDDRDGGRDDEDAAIIDPGPPSPTSLCMSALESLSDQPTACEACTCQSCVDPVLDCLTRPEEPVRALCRRVLDCAIRNGCRDWDCYCSSQRCIATTSAAGDGPCVEAIHAAVAGGREAVNAAHRDNNPTHPLVLAVRARSCSVGAPAGSVGGATEGACLPECKK
jgi:hypothetical protein